MAARKKARGKARAKRGKAPARKMAKAGKKPAKKAPVRRAPAMKKPVARRAPAAGPRPQPAITPAQLAPPGERIGVVTHYFSHLSVAVVKLETGTLRVGDTIHIRGHTSDFKQRVESLQVNHAPVAEVGPKDDFGLRVVEHVREHDVVYRVR